MRVCSLAKDFSLLQNGEDTHVGQKGHTLSGGQRSRVALARAIYADADLYLFDDPFSAIDIKVSEEIFENVFRGLLKRKTVLLNTHHRHFLEECD